MSHSTHMRIEPTNKMTRRRFLAAAGAGIVGLSSYGVVSNDLEPMRSTQRGPAAGQPLRVAVATDMHGPHNLLDHTQLLRTITDFQPHVLCVVGDAVDTAGDEALVALYGGIDAPLGKYAVLGNWEYEGDCDLDRLAREYERAGVRLLRNARVTLDHAGEPVALVGLDDWLRGRPDLGLVDALGPGDATAPRTLVLAHCPATFDVIAPRAPRPTIVLSGHTHGGQIAPFGIAVIVPEGSGWYVKGWYESPNEAHRLYVSRGLGNSGPPFRIGSRPEISLLTL
jgi:uncharacterized protein